jgi:hypothetical protein
VDEHVDEYLDELLARAVARLSAAGARDEVLVEYARPRWAGLRLSPKLTIVARVWRLGVLLLGHDAALYSTGTTLRVSEPQHPNAQSALAEQRRELRAIALRSGIAGGETINLDARDIRLDELTTSTRPVARTDDALFVQWSPNSDALTPFETYLAERVALLIDPPEGA